jgi:hypothetical protein
VIVVSAGAAFVEMKGKSKASANKYALIFFTLQN